MLGLYRKMIKTDAASSPLLNGLEQRIWGRAILSMPGFIVYTKKKARYVCNLSKKPSPRIFSTDAVRNRVIRNFTLNRGYDKSQTTMGFHDVSDLAAYMLAMPPGTNFVMIDLTGWFFQIMQR